MKEGGTKDAEDDIDDKQANIAVHILQTTIHYLRYALPVLTSGLAGLPIVSTVAPV